MTFPEAGGDDGTLHLRLRLGMANRIAMDMFRVLQAVYTDLSSGRANDAKSLIEAYLQSRLVENGPKGKRPAFESIEPAPIVGIEICQSTDESEKFLLHVVTSIGDVYLETNSLSLSEFGQRFTLAASGSDSDDEDD